jgi:hypothetical protein
MEGWNAYSKHEFVGKVLLTYLKAIFVYICINGSGYPDIKRPDYLARYPVHP